MIGLVLVVVARLLRLANIALLVYCVMSFVMPQHELYRKASYYMERVLRPIRSLLYRCFPSLMNMPLDFSPLVLWLLIDIAMSIVSRLGQVL